LPRFSNELVIFESNSNTAKSAEECVNLDGFLTNLAPTNRWGSRYQLLELETRNSVEKEKRERRDWRKTIERREGILINYLMKQLHIVSYLYNSHNASYC
jgi:hypothetical protein